MTPRHTARGIVVHEGQILLMERWRDDKHYFSIPGGGVEPGETPEQTVVREILEETTVKVAVDRLALALWAGDVLHQILLCNYLSGEPRLSLTAPERLHGPKNRFKPRWIPISELPQLPLGYWEPLHDALIEGLTQGWPDEPVEVKIAA